MKILFLTPFVPSQKGAAENFTRLLLKDFADKGHYVDLIYFRYKNDELYKAPSSNITIKKVFNNFVLFKLFNILNFPWIHPIFSVRFNWFILYYLKKLIKENHYDYVYLDHSQMFMYGHFMSLPIAMRAHDVMLQRYDRNGSNFSKWLVKQSEKFAINIPNSLLFCPTQKDVTLLFDNYGRQAFESKEYFTEDILTVSHDKIEKRLVLMGKWSRADNYEGLDYFVKKVVPQLKEEYVITIIGSGLSKELQESISQYKEIDYSGFMDNPYTIIANSVAVISPLFTGAGVKVKVIESLACGTPVVGSKISFEGIDNGCKSFMLVSNTPLEYVNNIKKASTLTLEQRKEEHHLFVSLYQQKTIPQYLINQQK